MNKVDSRESIRANLFARKSLISYASGFKGYSRHMALGPESEERLTQNRFARICSLFARIARITHANSAASHSFCETYSPGVAWESAWKYDVHAPKFAMKRCKPVVGVTFAAMKVGMAKLQERYFKSNLATCLLVLSKPRHGCNNHGLRLGHGTLAWV